MRVHKREHREEQEVAHDGIKNKNILDKVCPEKTCQNTFFRKGEGKPFAFFSFWQRTFPQWIHPQSIKPGEKQKEICKKTQKATRCKPVKDHAVRPVKPRLLAIHFRIIMLIKEQHKIVLPPTKKGSLFCSLPRHIPNEETRGSFCERNSGNALERSTFDNF